MAWIKERSRKNGCSYQVRWTEPGNKTEDTITFRDKAEAERTVRLLEANNNSMKLVDRLVESAGASGPTVRELMEQHIELLTNVGPYQIRRYKNAVAGHFSTGLGNLKAKSVEHMDIIQWIKSMQAKTHNGKPLSAKTIANHHGLLSAAMNTGIRLKLRPDNPCTGVRLPKDAVRTTDTMHTLSQDEWARVKSGLREPYSVFFQFLLATGLRFGEATALVASDFTLDGRTASVRVTKAWKQNETGGYYVGPPKTRKAVRTVSLAPSTADLVRHSINTAGAGLVFKNQKGDQIQSSAAHKAWGPAVAVLEKPADQKPRIHDLRHTHASWMINAGMEIFALSRRLGHESITTTMDRYSHLLPDANFSTAAVAEKALTGL